MSEPPLAGEAAYSRFELETFERVKALSLRHPPAQRPGVRAAVQLLLEAGTELPPDGTILALGSRTLRLVPRRVFRATGKGTSAVELFALRDEDKASVTARLIRKRVHRAALDVSNIRWLTEALFYLDLAPQVSCDGIRLPAFHGCRADDGVVTLVMEFLGNKPGEVPAAELLRNSAQAVGFLGAFTHVHALYEQPWAERVTHRLKPEALLALEYLVLGSLPIGEGENCLAAIEAFIDNPQLHHSLAEQGIACLVHGDLHLRNVLPLPDGTTGIIDWSHVGRGLIGEDVARLMLPHFVSHPAYAGQADFGATVQSMTSEVVAGAKALAPSLADEKINIAISRALLFATVNIATQNPEGWKQKLSGADENLRVRLQSIFRYAAETARQLEARFGG